MSNSSSRNSATVPSEMISVFPKTLGQERLVASIRSNTITLCTAPSGSGKTLLSIYEALQLQKKQEIRSIIYTKPLVDFPSLQGLGFLPGSLEEKILPMLYPVRDNLQIFCGEGMQDYIIRKKKIEPVLLQDLLGRSLNDSFIIFDEAQNAVPQVIELVLTRIGNRSKCVIMGDYNQKQSRDKFYDGLTDALYRLRDLEEVGIVEMDWSDCVRGDGLPSKIQQRYHS